MLSLFYEILVVGTYYGLLLVLSIYGLHRVYLVRLRTAHRNALPLLAQSPSMTLNAGFQPAFHPKAAKMAALHGGWPSVTVQLPIFNEPNVAERLIDAAATLEYPGPLEIQVLDDSTDVTSEIVARRAAELRARGVDIVHRRRDSREGFKAGALAVGMAESKGEFFAIFDADFVPPRRFLLESMPHFCDPQVGMVQARWTHLNREDSILTRVQAIYLDGHFAIESAARHLAACFFNFNGTAGVWRRQAIVDAGGWSSATLTEDLDLSYRAQLEGWRFVFLPDLEVPAELPASLEGFQGQQHRWTKGSMQTALKILPRLLATRLPWKLKAEAFFHLTGNVAYLLTLLLSLLLIPSLQIRFVHRTWWLLVLDLVLFGLSTSSIFFFFFAGQKAVGRRRPSWREILALIPIGVGLSVRNAAAVVEGLVQTGGQFHRTPKVGDRMRVVKSDAPRNLPVAELVLATFFAMSLAVLLAQGYYLALPFVILFWSGYSYVVATALREWFQAVVTN